MAGAVDIDDVVNARRALVRLVTNETVPAAEVADDEQALERLPLVVLAEATRARVRQLAAVVQQEKWYYHANLAAARQHCADVRPVLVGAGKRIIRTRQFLAARAEDPHPLHRASHRPPPAHQPGGHGPVLVARGSGVHERHPAVPGPSSRCRQLSCCHMKGRPRRMAYVLVADDDAILRALLRDLLTDEGHVVAEVADGQAALDHLRTTPHRWVVLLGYGLPVLDGPAVLQAVAADASLARRHAYIALSATPIWDRPVAALRAALGIPLLHKPFAVAHLLGAVAQAEARLGHADAQAATGWRAGAQVLSPHRIAAAWEQSALSRRLLRETARRTERIHLWLTANQASA